MNSDTRFGGQFDGDPETKAWADWPRCPRCGAPRETACPTCDIPGADFPLAELNPAAELLPVLDAEAEDPDLQRRGGECCDGAGARAGCAKGEEPGADDHDAPEAGLSPRAASAASADGPGVMLLCPTCDEAFSPRFYRWCESCGHDFGSGREGGPPEETATNYRIVLALFALVAGLVGLWVYLVWLFQK
jgi:hypothetical protein